MVDKKPKKGKEKIYSMGMGVSHGLPGAHITSRNGIPFGHPDYGVHEIHHSRGHKIFSLKDKKK